ncbi:MAG: hypothetical protein R3E12_14505 [Candidatus Eisenbacteria bacterium]
MDEKLVHSETPDHALPQDKRNEYLPLLGRIAELVMRSGVDKLRRSSSSMISGNFGGANYGE